MITIPEVATPSAGPNPDSSRHTRHASITVGGGHLVMAALSVFGYVVAIKGLVTPEDAARTATDIIDSKTMFRLGIGSLVLVVVLDVVVARALYRVFRPANEAISMLAAWFRLAYAAVFLLPSVNSLKCLASSAMITISRCSVMTNGTHKRSPASTPAATSGTLDSCSSASTWSSSPISHTPRVLFRSCLASYWPSPVSATSSTASQPLSPARHRRSALTHSSASSCWRSGS